METLYQVQTGKGKRAYDVKYPFVSWNNAVFHFNCINTHSGYKKRLVDMDGKVVARVIT